MHIVRGMIGAISIIVSLYGCTGSEVIVTESALDASSPSDASPVLSACPGQAGYVCTRGAIPSGWNVVARSIDVNQPCPNAFEGSEEVLGAPKGEPLGCVCNCTGSPACTTFTLDRFFVAACGGAPAPVVTVFGGTDKLGVCQPGGYSTPTDVGYLKVVTPPPSDSECVAAPTAAERPPVAGERQRLCKSTAAEPLRACDTGVCVPEASGSYSVCIAHEGEEACPAGFPLRILAGTGETPFADSRGCGPCTCTVKGTCSASVMFSADGCTTGPTQNTETCRKEGALVDMTSHKLTAYSNTRTCGTKSPSMPTGGVVPTSPRTICCP